jgi:hypothetical protein
VAAQDTYGVFALCSVMHVFPVVSTTDACDCRSEKRTVQTSGRSSTKSATLWRPSAQTNTNIKQTGDSRADVRR